MTTNKLHKNQRTTKINLFSVMTGIAFACMLLISLLSLSAFASAATTDSTNSLTILKIDFLNQQPDPVEPGSYVDLRWQVTNLGAKATDYVFSLSPDYPFSFDNPSDANITQSSTTSFQTTDTGAILYYRVRVASDAVEGSINKARLTYYRADGIGGSAYIEQPVRIQSRQGLVNVGNVQVNPEKVSLGSVFNVSLDVDNFASSFITNAKVALDTDALGLIPFGGSSQKTVSRIESKTNATFTFQYFVGPNAQINVAAIPVTITYIDSLGRNNTISTTIGVQISADSSYFANLDQSTIFIPDTQGKIVVSISNTGKSDINFATLELVETNDYVVVGPSTSYLGNLKSDDLQTGQFNVYVKPTSATSIPLTFKLTYKDVYNQNVVEEFTLDNKLYDKALAQKLGLLPASSSTGSIIFVVLILAVVGYFWYRHNKKKKAMNLKKNKTE